MKGLVFGAGFLGTRIAEELGYELIGRDKLEVLNMYILSSFLDFSSPDLIINATGKTGRPNIDWCEENKEETVQSNISAAINLCIEASKRKIYFVHLGSGCIYYGDNQGRGWKEEDEPNFYGPQFYAKTKIDAERVLKQFPGLILRIRMPIDDRPHERNLIDKLIKYPKVIDIKNSMTTVPHMIKAMQFLIERRVEGIYNFTNPGVISAAEIMRAYRETVNPEHKFDIMSLEELNNITKGKRSNCYLDTSKLQRELKGSAVEIPEIHEAVKYCLEEYKK